MQLPAWSLRGGSLPGLGGLGSRDHVAQSSCDAPQGEWATPKGGLVHGSRAPGTPACGLCGTAPPPAPCPPCLQVLADAGVGFCSLCASTQEPARPRPLHPEWGGTVVQFTGVQLQGPGNEPKCPPSMQAPLLHYTHTLPS